MPKIFINNKELTVDANATVLDAGGNPVAGATVNAVATGGTADTVSGTADSSGKVRLILTNYLRHKCSALLSSVYSEMLLRSALLLNKN